MDRNMNYHSLLAAALQKYYSALKSLDEFGQSGNIFDDISNLDKFFSEFRNITFVIQKELKTPEDKSKYFDARDEFLSSETLKWFVDTRNRTTKERPFDLQKELEIDIYLPFGLYTLKDTRLIIDFDKSFDEALKFIRSEFFEKLKLVEVHFTVRIVFREVGNTVDLYPRIKQGISQMNKFLKAMIDRFPHECVTCDVLKRQTKELLQKVESKELLFQNDYYWEADNEPEKGGTAEIYVASDDTECIPFSGIRLSLDNELFGESKDCLIELFYRFISLHILIFQKQMHRIMPVFMLIYKDQTYKMIPFVASTNATFYRKVLEVTNIPDFNDVEAVFYCGEYYIYDSEQWPYLNQKPYSQRIESAKSEALSFVMIIRSGDEMAVFFDEERIDDKEYIAHLLKNMQWMDSNKQIYWLNPLRIKMKENNPV